jgi:hypothetical protein
MAKKKPMSRTSGVARRLTKRDEGIATKLKYGAPLTGSASGVKSISLKDVGEVLTQGIVTLGKKGLQMDPAALAFALPLGKVAKAANALKNAGRIEEATALSARLGAKTAGKFFGASERGIATDRAIDVGGRARMASEKVFPRATKSNVSEGTLNIVDTRRMNPAQAKAALEGGVSQTAKIARRIPGKEKPVRGATARLLKGRGR